MTLSPQAALSILIPINIEHRKSPGNVPSSPADSLSSIDVQSDDENDREVVERRLSRYYPTSPVSVGPIVRPQLSCPDLGMGTARGMKARLREPAPPVPALPTFHLQQPSSPTPHGGEVMSVEEGTSSPSPRSKARQQNNFLPLDSLNKRPWEDSFGQGKNSPQKRHGIFFRRLNRYHPSPYSPFGLEPPNQYRRSRFLTSFDELFKPDLPSAQRYVFRDDTSPEEEGLRERIRQGLEDSIIPSARGTPVKMERTPLKERIRGLINTERPKKRRRFWLEKIVGKKRRLPPRPNENQG